MLHQLALKLFRYYLNLKKLHKIDSNQIIYDKKQQCQDLQGTQI